MKKKVEIIMLPKELDNGKEMHLYATVSQDVEEIKEGDWFICSDHKNSHKTLGIVSHIGKPFNFKNTIQINGNVDLHIDRYGLDYARKVIASTDPELTVPVEKAGDNVWHNPIPQLQQSFIEEFVANPDSNWEVEFKEQKTKESDKEYLVDFFKTVLKVNPDNTINITLVEEKMYSKDEFISKLHEYWNGIHGEGHSNSNMINWIKENLK